MPAKNRRCSRRWTSDPLVTTMVLLSAPRVSAPRRQTWWTETADRGVWSFTYNGSKPSANIDAEINSRLAKTSSDVYTSHLFLNPLLSWSYSIPNDEQHKGDLSNFCLHDKITLYMCLSGEIYPVFKWNHKMVWGAWSSYSSVVRRQIPDLAHIISVTCLYRIIIIVIPTS